MTIPRLLAINKYHTDTQPPLHRMIAGYLGSYKDKKPINAETSTNDLAAFVAETQLISNQEFTLPP